MKINRFFAMAALAVLVVGAIGVFGARAYADAQESANPGQATEAPDNETVDTQAGSVGQEAADATEVSDGVGSQAEAQTGTETPGTDQQGQTGEQGQAGEQGQHDEQSPAYTGSLTVDPATIQG